MKIYRPTVVQELIDFYGPLLPPDSNWTNIQQHIVALAEKMWEGVQQKNPGVISEISNHHPDHLGKDKAEILAANLTPADCLLTQGRQYGFNSPAEASGRSYQLPFEIAVEALLAGDKSLLVQQLNAHPDIPQRRSAYGHRATLLHYAGSNGVEMWRQQVPENLPELTVLLLKAGADPNAVMYVYGGEHTVKELVATSAHPFAAGVAESLLALLP